MGDDLARPAERKARVRGGRWLPVGGAEFGGRAVGVGRQGMQKNVTRGSGVEMVKHALPPSEAACKRWGEKWQPRRARRHAVVLD